jgi:hypothetical protein
VTMHGVIQRVVPVTEVTELAPDCPLPDGPGSVRRIAASAG